MQTRKNRVNHTPHKLPTKPKYNQKPYFGGYNRDLGCVMDLFARQNGQFARRNG